MNASRLLFAIAALLFAENILPAAAHAGDRLAAAAPAVIQDKFLEPLKKKEDERSRFSRAALPPSSRRLRVLDDSARTDARGRRFVTFAIDETRGFGVVKDADASPDDWLENAIVGCVYPETGDVLIKRGESYLGSSVLLGKPSPTPPDGACRARSWTALTQ